MNLRWWLWGIYDRCVCVDTLHPLQPERSSPGCTGHTTQLMAGRERGNRGRMCLNHWVFPLRILDLILIKWKKGPGAELVKQSGAGWMRLSPSLQDSPSIPSRSYITLSPLTLLTCNPVLVFCGGFFPTNFRCSNECGYQFLRKRGWRHLN